MADNKKTKSYANLNYKSHRNRLSDKRKRWCAGTCPCEPFAMFKI